MKTFAKAIISLALLFLGGCAYHSGYYSGYSDEGFLSIGVDSYTPYQSYPLYYDRHVYVNRPFVRQNRGHKHYKGHRDRYDYYQHKRDRHRKGKKYNTRRGFSSNKFYSDRRRRDHRSGHDRGRRRDSGDRQRRRNRDGNRSGNRFRRDR